VRAAEALQMHAALEKRGLKSPLIIFGDEGHGTQKRGNQVQETGQTLKFLSEHLKGP
jgi:dipeptidyl aminopeptidase/acylaminoacyl peptidase